MLVEKIAGVTKVTNAEVGLPEPKSTHGMVDAEIIEAVCHDPTMVTDRTTGKTTGKLYDYMQAVSTAIFDREYWKRPVVIVDDGDSNIDCQWVIAAIKFFHGVNPDVTFGSDGTVVVISSGYGC